MNSKIIAAGVVVALCAVALIGVGYAYNATMTNENTIESEYVVLDVAGTGKATPFFKTGSKLAFNTETTSKGTKWSSSDDVQNSEGQFLKITGKATGDVTKIDLELTTKVVTISGESVTEDLTNTFAINVLKNSTIKFTNIAQDQSTDIIEYSYNKGTSKWDCTDNKTFTIGSQYKVSLSVNEFESTEVLSSSDLVFQMTLKYNSIQGN